jgi:hypothetical protein
MNTSSLILTSYAPHGVEKLNFDICSDFTPGLLKLMCLAFRPTTFLTHVWAVFGTVYNILIVIRFAWLPETRLSKFDEPHREI